MSESARPSFADTALPPTEPIDIASLIASYGA
jgi:hypothetical protein